VRHEQRSSQRPCLASERQSEKIAGKVVGNKDLERKGKNRNAIGEVQAKYGDLKEDIKKSI
jgi:hypothetical protein